MKLVVTGADTPAKLTSAHRKEHRILACEVVRHIGEEVAAVVATTEDIARRSGPDRGRVRGTAGGVRCRGRLAGRRGGIHASTRNRAYG